MDRSQFKKIPQKPGAYLFKDFFGKVIYVGKARNLKNRISSYFQKGIVLGDKTAQLVKNIKTIDYIIVESEIEALLLEANLVKKYQPKYNIELKDGKSYPYIKITDDPFPRVILVRKKINDLGKYFGPYPDGTSVRKILNYIRYIFPFCTHKKAYESCLFIHLGICPGPGLKISKTDYKKNIRNITNFLEGKSKAVLNNLKNEMAVQAKKENYKEATKIKKQLEKLESATQEVKEPYEYLRNPNLVNDLAEKRLIALAQLLSLSKAPQRIECYDVSNISGTDASSSMVVMINGQMDLSEYKKFKIRKLSTPNDVGMLEETIERRMKHKEWGIPDLIVVDGGISQVNTVYKTLQKGQWVTPVIGLAKRLEEIFYPGKRESQSTEINKEAKFLLQTIRNEAHRFAKAYHLFLRSKRQVR